MAGRLGGQVEERPLVSAAASAVPAFLMCSPDHYDAFFLFNPWMTFREKVDHHLAEQQWWLLHDTLVDLGARVWVMHTAGESAPAVFTADMALVYRPGWALVLRNDGPRSFFEPDLVRAELREAGFEVESLPPAYRLDGGNILRLPGGQVLIGLKPGSRGRAEAYLAKLLRRTTGEAVRPLALHDRRFLHLDTAVANLAGRALAVYWEGLHPISRAHLREWWGGPFIPVDLEDALHFGCNVVSVGETIVTGPISDRLAEEIRALGPEVIRLELSEFYKAGGGAKCLTLPLG